MLRESARGALSAKEEREREATSKTPRGRNPEESICLIFRGRDFFSCGRRQRQLPQFRKKKLDGESPAPPANPCLAFIPHPPRGHVCDVPNGLRAPAEFIARS